MALNDCIQFFSLSPCSEVQVQTNLCFNEIFYLFCKSIASFIGDFELENTASKPLITLKLPVQKAAYNKSILAKKLQFQY